MNKRNQLQAMGLAVMVECVVLAGAAYALTSTASMKPVLSGSTAITLAQEDQQPLKPPAPKPKPQPKPQVVPEEPKPELPQVTEAQATAFTEPTPPPPEAVVGKAEPSAEYAAKVHAAVQAAHYYPPAASSLRYSGRVRVEFHLRDTTPGELRLMVASGFGLIDRAALQAVQTAHYPEPPPELQGSDHVYQVWVEFNRK
jgi:protein TonB